jgi:uncharacterized OB-fold protein
VATNIKRSDLPTIENDTRAYWDAARQGQLMIGHCKSCSTRFFYPRPLCPNCWSGEVELTAATGRGTLYTYSVVYMNDLSPFDQWLPYIAAMVDLEEGVRISTNIVDCDTRDLKIGMPLIVSFRQADEGLAVPVFRPATAN